MALPFFLTQLLPGLILLGTLFPAALIHAAEKSAAAATQLFSAPDESSPPAGAALTAGENPTPIAETVGSGGSKWHLVKTKDGLFGWIKLSDSDQSKKLESFFQSLPRESSVVAVAIPKASASAAPGGSIVVPVQFVGRSAIVSAVLNGTVKGSLLLDTGATSTVISHGLARLLAIQPIGATIGQTVGGLITAPVARLSSVKLGDAEVAGLTVMIHDFSRDPRIQGLLGMDFLSQFHLGLDTQKRLLVLSPR